MIAAIFLIAEYNRFVQLKHKIKQAKSGIDVYLTQRFDLIPNLVECVKGYAAHEEKVFTEMARLRGEYDFNWYTDEIQFEYTVGDTVYTAKYSSLNDLMTSKDIVLVK